MVSYGMVWYAMVCHGMVWYGTVCHVVWYGMVRYIMWYGIVIWSNVMWHVQCSVVNYGKNYTMKILTFLIFRFSTQISIRQFVYYMLPP